MLLFDPMLNQRTGRIIQDFPGLFFIQGRVFLERSQPGSFFIPRLPRASLTLAGSMLVFNWLYPTESASWQIRLRVPGFPPEVWMVLTLPHELNPLILQNQEVLYNLLFQTASQALQKLALGYPRLQAQLGFTAVLHTWDQHLQFHPHLHLVVTGGGLDPSPNHWVPAKNSFLVPVKALSQIVRGKFLDALKETFHEGKLSFRGNTESLKEESTFDRFLKKLRRQKWVAYSKTSPELISKLAQNAKREFSSAGPSFLPSQRKLFWIPHEPSPDPKKPKLSKPLTKASRKVMSKIPNLECGSLPPIQKPYAPNPFQSETLPLTPPNISPTPPP